MTLLKIRYNYFYIGTEVSNIQPFQQEPAFGSHFGETVQ